MARYARSLLRGGIRYVKIQVPVHGCLALLNYGYKLQVLGVARVMENLMQKFDLFSSFFAVRPWAGLETKLASEVFSIESLAACEHFR